MVDWLAGKRARGTSSERPIPASTETYSTAGSYTYTVPSGVSSITIKSWGAGGSSTNTSAKGGTGGYAQGTISVSAGNTLAVVVGSSTGGGNGGSGNGVGAKGGGYSGVFITSVSQGNARVIAGGGGGAGGTYQTTGGYGGAGGGTTGRGGYITAGNNTPQNNYGTQSAGGSGSVGGFSTGTSGGALTGGNGGAGTGTYAQGGGGGGSGYYGGGGGGAGGGNYDANAHGGGGGSGYVISSATNTSNLQGYAAYYNNDGNPPNTGDSDYVGSAGQPANSGLVVIIPTASPVNLQDGTIFEETDTNKAYIWNATTTTWTQL